MSSYVQFLIKIFLDKLEEKADARSEFIHDQGH